MSAKAVSGHSPAKSIRGQYRCPKCRANTISLVKVNKYVHDFPYVCQRCKTVREGLPNARTSTTT